MNGKKITLGQLEEHIFKAWIFVNGFKRNSIKV
jgi:hypothetical protein